MESSESMSRRSELASELGVWVHGGEVIAVAAMSSAWGSDLQRTRPNMAIPGPFPLQVGQCSPRVRPEGEADRALLVP